MSIDLKTSKSNLVKRIEDATPLQLTIINYELLLENIAAATNAKPRSTECSTALDKARECLSLLYTTLDMDIDFSKDLAELYLFVNRCLIQAGMKRNDEEKNPLLADATNIITEMLGAWQTLAADDNLLEKLLGADSQQVIAGLTYGKDGKAVEYHDQDYDPNRGYRA